MELVSDPGQWRQRLREQRATGHRVGFVPTMGALHEGHISLIDRLRSAGADFITLSIFVNPTQFNDAHDLATYPRQLEEDLEAARGAGVDLVFTPDAESLRQTRSSTQILPPVSISNALEGAFRPEHFVGMATVVTKLLVLANPCIAAFGKKDYQQLTIIRHLVRDLCLDVDVVAGATVREPGGLARSSRNERLSPSSREDANALYLGLAAARGLFEGGEASAQVLRDAVSNALINTFDSVDYVEIVSQDDLERIGGQIKTPAVILVAASIGGVRLIDNVELNVPNYCRD